MNDADLNEFVLANMPHFIAVNYQRLLLAKVPKERVEQALHTYNLGLRALTIGLVSQYLIRDRDDMSDPYLNELLLKKFPHLTLDAWQQILFASLRAYEGKRDLFFMPELYDFYWDTSTLPHRRRVEVEQPFERLTQIALEIQAERLLPQDETGWQELAEETLELLQQILRGMAFIGQYDLIRVLDYDDQCYDFELHKGLKISVGSESLPTHTELNKGWFYLREGPEDFLLLHPLLVFWEGESDGSKPVPTDTGVYDRFVYERLQYLLATLGRTFVDDKSVKAFVTLLYDTIEDAKRKRQRAGRLTWWQLRDICADITHQRMATVRGKYRSELYLQREETRQAFEGFLASDKRCFVLIGKSGVGKSNFLLALGEEVHQSRSDVCVLMYDGAYLKVEPSVTGVINQDFDNRLVLAGHRVQDVWREIAQVDGIEERLVVFCVDAINENSEARELLRQLDELVQGPWPWLKVVFSSRPETWHSIKRGVRLSEALYFREEGADRLGVELEPFSYSERMELFSRQELPEAYTKYQNVFNVQTEYTAIPGEIRETLREPLNLWLVANTYSGQTIPITLKVAELIEQYVNALLRSERLRKEDLQLLEKQLVPLMLREGHYSNAISIADIDAAGGGLYEAIYSEQALSDGRRMNQSFTNLLDADILVRKEEGREQEIAFKYERFYEYYAGKQIFELASAASKRQVAYLNFLHALSSYYYLWGALQVALQRELNMGHYNIIENLASQEWPMTKEIVVATLVTFGRESFEAAEGLVKRMYSSHHPQVRKTALSVAGELGIQPILISAGQDPDVSIRLAAVRSAYLLWQKESPSGWNILRAWANNVKGTLGLPRTKVIEPCLALSVLIMTDRGLTDEHLQSIIKALQSIWKQMLADLFFVRGDEVGIVSNRMSLRGFLFTQVVYLLSRFLKRPEFRWLVGGWVPLVMDFFPLASDRRSSFKELLSCFDLTGEEIISKEELLAEVLMWNDLLSTWIVSSIIMLKLPPTGDQGLDLVRRLFKSTLRDDRPLLCSGYLAMSGWSFFKREPSPISNAAFAIYRDMELEYFDATTGLCYSKKGDVYINLGLDLFSDVEWNRYRKRRPEMLIHALQSAISIKHPLVLEQVIGEVIRLSNTYNHPELALEAAKVLLDQDDPIIKEKLVNCLAGIRLYYPQEVEEFLDENAVSHDTRQLVRVKEVAPNVWGQILVPNQGLFMLRIMSQPGVTKTVIRLLNEALDCTNFDQWLRIVLEEVISLSYRKPVSEVGKAT